MFARLAKCNWAGASGTNNIPSTKCLCFNRVVISAAKVSQELEVQYSYSLTSHLALPCLLCLLLLFLLTPRFTSAAAAGVSHPKQYWAAAAACPAGAAAAAESSSRRACRCLPHHQQVSSTGQMNCAGQAFNVCGNKRVCQLLSCSSTNTTAQ